MKRFPISFLLSLLGVFLFQTATGMAAETTIAVAANFSETLQVLAKSFQTKTGHTIVVTSGSTGKLYAQIKNGAPFTAFFSADAERPTKLEQEHQAIAGTRFTYAIGKVVLWSPKPGVVDQNGTVLITGGFLHIALANPKLAPYGAAAQQVLEKKGLWTSIQSKLVFGEDIGQTYQFVFTGNAEIGFIALSQIKTPQKPMAGSYWEVPQSLYSPIDQQAILLKDDEVARAFLKFVKEKESLETIHSFGYGTP